MIDKVIKSFEIINNTVEEIFKKENFKNFLDFQGRLYFVDINNQILLYKQKPELKRIITYPVINEVLNKNVKPDTPTLAVLIPLIYKEGSNASIFKTSFMSSYVFDLEEVEEVENTRYEINYESIVRERQGLNILRLPKEEFKTYKPYLIDIPEGVIYIKEGIEKPEQALINAYIEFVAYKNVLNYDKDILQREVEAVKYIVLNHFNIPTQFSLIGFSKLENLDTANKKNVLTFIQNLSSKIIQDLNKPLLDWMEVILIQQILNFTNCDYLKYITYVKNNIEDKYYQIYLDNLEGKFMDCDFEVFNQIVKDIKNHKILTYPFYFIETNYKNTNILL